MPGHVGGAPEKGTTTMTEFTEKEDQSGIEAVLDEVIDLEEYAKRGERPPLSKGYRIRVNGEPFVVHDPNPTGRAILTLAGLLPVEEYTLHDPPSPVRFAAG
jgi:Multiubiquitin